VTWRFFPYFLLRATGFPVEKLTRIAEGRPGISVERERLFSALSDDASREALMTSAPLVDENFDGWWARAKTGRRNTEDRKRERVLWRYLQRFAAKNDSTSFFGPIGAGRFDFEMLGKQDTRLPVDSGRSVFTTQWVVERLLSVALSEIGEDVEHGEAARAHRRRAPGADSEGHVWEPGGRGFRVSEGPAEVGIGALPSGLLDPVAEAITRLRSLPDSEARDRWVERFEWLERQRQAFEKTARRPLERRSFLKTHQRELGAILGETPSRHEGEFYASRGPLHEQAERTGRIIGLEKGWREGFQQALNPLLELSLLPARLERVMFRHWFRETFGEDKVLWRDVLDTLAKAPHEPDLRAPPEVRRVREGLKKIRADLQRELEDLEKDGGQEVALAPHPEVARLLEELGPCGTAYANPDLMVAISGGQPRWVLAEAHYLPILTGSLLPPLACADEVIGATRGFLHDLTAPDLPAFPVSFDHSFISVGPDFGAIGLELSGLAKEPPDRRATFAELECHLEGDRFVFEVMAHDGRLLRVAPMTRTARLHQASPTFAVPVLDFGSWLAGPDWRPRESLPRVLYGGLIVHRRRFRLSPEACAKMPQAPPYEVLSALYGAGLPRFMFMRVPSEPKPILVDWQSELATELAKWSLTRGETLELSEMLPAPDECWLEGPGGHYTSELRAVIVRR
jgi:hypothetical protein